MNFSFSQSISAHAALAAALIERSALEDKPFDLDDDDLDDDTDDEGLLRDEL